MFNPPPHANFNKLTLKLACHYKDSCSSEAFPASAQLSSQEFKLSPQAEQCRVQNRTRTLALPSSVAPTSRHSQNWDAQGAHQRPSLPPSTPSSSLWILHGSSLEMFPVIIVFNVHSFCISGSLHSFKTLTLSHSLYLGLCFPTMDKSSSMC